MRVRVVLGVALALVGVALAVALSQRGERMAGTSFVPIRTLAVTVPPHGRACQPATYVADDSAAARIFVGTDGKPRPALSLTFTDANRRLLARGSVAGGGVEGEVSVPFGETVEGNRFDATACVTNLGAVQIGLGGDVAGPATAARVGGEVTQGAIGFRYLRSGRESWWAMAPVIAQRAGLGKSGAFGTWTLPLLALLLAGIWFVALRLLLRESS